jgi:hypothetical protein
MKAFVLSVLFFTCLQLSAQRECATTKYIDQQKALHPSFSDELISIEKFIQSQSAAKVSASSSSAYKVAASVIRIPVIIHVLYNTESQNVSDAQIKWVLEALNRDFRKKNSDTVNVPERFKHLAADVELEFVLATADPKGRATTGVFRKRSNVTEWKMDDKIKFSAQGGNDAWDSKSYLNIWVGNMRNLLGYSSAPGSSTAADGVVINPSTFNINSGGAYNLGRTIVHEVGHWLGLKHIWGDTYCGDDMVDDTPKQGNFTAGCPTVFRTSCGNGSLGDMYMNYMDFTNDACMNLFTEGQKKRMRSLFNEGGPRATLLSSKGLSRPWLEEAPLDKEPAINTELKLFPNPASSEIVLDFSYDVSWIGKEINIYNANGNLVKKSIISTKTQKLLINNLSSGIYFIIAQNGDKKINKKLVKL